MVVRLLCIVIASSVFSTISAQGLLQENDSDHFLQLKENELDNRDHDKFTNDEDPEYTDFSNGPEDEARNKRNFEFSPIKKNLYKFLFRRNYQPGMYGRRYGQIYQKTQHRFRPKSFIGDQVGSEFLGKRGGLGSEFLGKRAMGSEFLGKRAMGSEFLGKRAMGSEFLGKRAMGSEFLGKRAMGSEFLGKRAMGSEFLGKRAMGSEFLGKRAMGSEFLGKRAMGSEFLGKRAMGSEFLGKRFSTSTNEIVNPTYYPSIPSSLSLERQENTQYIYK